MLILNAAILVPAEPRTVARPPIVGISTYATFRDVEANERIDIKGMCVKEKKKRREAEKKNTDTTDREMSP